MPSWVRLPQVLPVWFVIIEGSMSLPSELRTLVAIVNLHCHANTWHSGSRRHRMTSQQRCILHRASLTVPLLRLLILWAVHFFDFVVKVLYGFRLIWAKGRQLL